MQQLVDQSPWDERMVRANLARRVCGEIEPSVWVIADAGFAQMIGKARRTLTGGAAGETVGDMADAPARILVVANRTAAAERLLKTVEHRAAETPCTFTLLVPDVANAREADWTLDTARRLLAKAAGGPVGGLTGGPDPFVAVQEAVATGEFDEIIISTLPRGVSKWLRRDLVARVRGLGLPVTSIIPGDRPRRGMAEDMMGMTGDAYHAGSRGSGAEDR